VNIKKKQIMRGEKMKDTRILEMDSKHIDREKLIEAAAILRNGGTVAFPTETVYGLGANALDEQAVKKIFQAKGRPSDNPLIVHIAKIEDIEELVEEIPCRAKKLMEHFWPGPLTILFKKTNKIPDAITAGLDTVAIRMPSHPIARALIQIANIPIAAPSANLSGKPSPTQPHHVIEDLKGKVDMILCGGHCSIGLESTVLDITGESSIILRPGGITKEQLEEVLGNVQVDAAIEGRKGLIPKSPGMKYTHYAPKAEVIIISGETKKRIEAIHGLKEEREKEGLKVGIMATDETKAYYDTGEVISVGSRKNLASIATNLFAILRLFDERGVDVILAEEIEQKSIGYAVMNRMMKAAGYHIIKVGRR
jgi:L-threonylcarbamoyladenylate synthase